MAPPTNTTTSAQPEPPAEMPMAILIKLFLIAIEILLSVALLFALAYAFAVLISYDRSHRRVKRPAIDEVFSFFIVPLIIHGMGSVMLAGGSGWPFWFCVLFSIACIFIGALAIVLTAAISLGLYYLAKGRLDRLFASSDAEREEQRRQQEYNALPSGEAIEMDDGFEISPLAKATDEEHAHNPQQAHDDMAGANGGDAEISRKTEEDLI